MPLDFNVRVTGVAEMVAALRRLPLEARNEFRKEATKLSRELANKFRSAARSGSKGRMGNLIAPTVRAQTGLSAGVLIGPTPVLFGSEFGANGRYGWYADDRFRNSVGRQYLPRNAGGYWWHPTIEENGPAYDAALARVADRVQREWGG